MERTGLILLTFPLTLLAIYLYGSLQRFRGRGERRRYGPRLFWTLALVGVLYLAWRLIGK